MTITDLYRQFLNLVHQYEHLLRILTVGSLGFFLLTPLLAPLIIVLIPEDILVRHRHPLREGPLHRRVLYFFWHVIKNLLGTTLLLLGFLLLFLPGQGLLTLFIGVLFSDLPGKRRLLRRLLGSGKVKPVIDRLRRRYRRKPLMEPD